MPVKPRRARQAERQTKRQTGRRAHTRSLARSRKETETTCLQSLSLTRTAATRTRLPPAVAAAEAIA